MTDLVKRFSWVSVYAIAMAFLEAVVEVLPHQGYVVPKGVVHRTRAPQKTVVLMIETAGIVPTGDA